MGLHPQVVSLLRAMAEDDAPPPADLAAERAEYLDSAMRLGGAAEPVAGFEDVVVPSFDGGRLRARVYAPLHAPDTDALVVWLHGGGWYVGDIPTFDRVARVLANAAGAKVLMVEYRLAPEHRWPTQVRDAEAVVAWALGAGAAQLEVDPGRVVLGGDSAGGQLAVVAARHAPAPLRALLLAYPALDPTLSSESYKTFAEGPMLTKADMERCWGFYLGDEGEADRSDPDVAPLRADDLGALPPTSIAVAEEDVLRDDGVMLAEALERAGVPVELRECDGMVHGFLRWGGVVDEAGDTLRWFGDRARAALDAAPMA